MKTIINQQQPLLCEGRFSLRSWLLDLRYAIRIYLSVALRKSSRLASKIRLPHRLASAVREMSAGLSALVNSSTVNMRIYVGLVLVWVLAPLSLSICYIFDKSVLDFSWYHVNYWYLFAALGPWMAMFFFTLGMFHINPYNKLTLYNVIPPISFTVIKMFKIVLCTSNTEWNAFPSVEIISVGILSSIVLIISIEHFAWRQFHKYFGHMCRLEGLTEISSMTEAEKTMFKNEIKKAKTFSF